MRGFIGQSCTAILALTCPWLAGVAGADTALRIQNGDRVRAALDQPGELDIYRFTAPEGVDVRVEVRARRSGPDLEVSVSDDGARVRQARPRRKVSRIDLRDVAEGSYLVGVKATDGAETGNYRLKISWRSKRTRTSVVHVDAAPTEDGPLSGFAISEAFTGVGGEVARISVSPAKQSSVEPYLESLDPRAPLVGAATAVPLGGVNRADVPLTAVLGRYVVVVGNDAAVGGDAIVRVKLRRERRRLDLRDLSVPPGAHVLVAGSVTPRAGGALRVIDVDDESTLPGVPALPAEFGELLGARIDIAPAVVPRSATFVLASAPPLDPAVPGVDPAGATLFAGPVGLARDEGIEADVTLPCGVLTPRVFTRRADGSVVEIAAGDIEVEGYLRPVARFRARIPATFQAFSQRARYSTVAVAASDDHLVVGVPGEVVDGRWNAGSVLVYARNGGTWVEEARILPDEPADQGLFGVAVALDGDTLVVDRSGKTVVYVRDPAAGWVYQDELRTADGSALLSSIFAIDGDTIVAGVPWTDRAVRVFVRVGAEWAEEQLIPAPDEFASFLFGLSVDVSGETLVVGAAFGGIAWAYVRSDGDWRLQSKLRSSDAVAGMTSAVAIDGDTAVVGTTYDPNGFGGSIGEAYVFRRIGDEWTDPAEVQRPADLPVGPEIAFGRSLDLRGRRLLVGAPEEQSQPPQRGRAYVFDDDGTAFVLSATLGPTGEQAAPLLGRELALSPDGTTAILGADGATDGANSLTGSLVFDVEETIGSE